MSTVGSSVLATLEYYGFTSSQLLLCHALWMLHIVCHFFLCLIVAGICYTFGCLLGRVGGGAPVRMSLHLPVLSKATHCLLLLTTLVYPMAAHFSQLLLCSRAFFLVHYCTQLYFSYAFFVWLCWGVIVKFHQALSPLLRASMLSKIISFL